MNRELVVVVLISDWIKLYINTISRYTTRDDNENDDVIGASRSTVVNTSVTSVNNIGIITDTIINCNIPVDNNDNILGRYASSRSIIRIDTTKFMYVSTTSTFEELMNDVTTPTTKNYIGVMIMGSNCLVDLRLRRKSHGLWRTTRTYQWRYSWYKLDGRGVTGFCAAESGDTHPIGVGLMTKVHQGIKSL